MCILNIYILEQTPGNLPGLDSKLSAESEYLTFQRVGKKWLQRRTSKQLILGTAILILIMLAIIASTIAFLTKYIPKNQLQIYDEEIDSNKPNNDPEANNYQETIMEDVIGDPDYIPTSNADQTALRRTSRQVRVRQFKDYLTYPAVANAIPEKDPESVKETMAGQSSEMWKSAMLNEMESLDENNTWSIGKLPEDPDVNITMIPKWVDRKTWLARPPNPGVSKLKTPVPYVVIHHTATEECHVLADCKAQVQAIQTFHMDSNVWSDIGYNFVIGGDGYIYEARGWTNQGAHVKGYNNVSIGIAFIGLFDDHLPPRKSLLAAQHVIKVGVEQNYIKKDYKLFGMRQLSTFKSPGQKLYEEIKTWPHWSATL